MLPYRLEPYPHIRIYELAFRHRTVDAFLRPGTVMHRDSEPDTEIQRPPSLAIDISRHDGEIACILPVEAAVVGKIESHVNQCP